MVKVELAELPVAQAGRQVADLVDAGAVDGGPVGQQACVNYEEANHRESPPRRPAAAGPMLVAFHPASVIAAPVPPILYGDAPLPRVP